MAGKMSNKQTKKLEEFLTRNVKDGIWISPLDQSVYFTDEIDGETVELLTETDVEALTTLSENEHDLHERIAYSVKKQLSRKMVDSTSFRL